MWFKMFGLILYLVKNGCLRISTIVILTFGLYLSIRITRSRASGQALYLFKMFSTPLPLWFGNLIPHHSDNQ